MIGAGIFAIYGLLIQSYPVAVMNFAIVIINIYYLREIYTKKEYFKLIELRAGSEYFKYFIDFHKEDIKDFFSYLNDDYINDIFKKMDIGFYITRNVIPAGVFIAKKIDEDTLEVVLDYVIKDYRDFRVGEFIFKDNKDLFLNKGFNKIISFSKNEDHKNYLLKMGFKPGEDNKNLFIKNLKEEV